MHTTCNTEITSFVVYVWNSLKLYGFQNWESIYRYLLLHNIEGYFYRNFILVSITSHAECILINKALGIWDWNCQCKVWCLWYLDIKLCIRFFCTLLKLCVALHFHQTATMVKWLESATYCPVTSLAWVWSPGVALVV